MELAPSGNPYIDDSGLPVSRRSMIAFADTLGYRQRIPEAAGRGAEQEPLSEVHGGMTRTYIGLRACAIATFIFLGLSACSVTDYKKPIGDMAAAVDQSIASINKLDQRITAVRNEQWRKDLADKTAGLFPVDDKCSLGSKQCWLEIKHKKNKKVSTKRFPSTSFIPKARAGLAGLKAYVANLRSIVEADTVNKVTASANAALGSLKNIETAVEKAGDKAGPVAKFGAPTVSAINWFIGQYVDYVKVRALKKATNTAQPVIVKLAKFYDTIAKAAADYELGIVGDAFVLAKKAYRKVKPPNSQSIDQYVSAVQKYDRALRATAARPLKAFEAAHTKLNDQLNGKISLSEALAAIENLVERAKAFKAIVDEFDQASSN